MQKMGQTLSRVASLLDWSLANDTRVENMLGHINPQRYIVFNQNRDEIRANGGFRFLRHGQRDQDGATNKVSELFHGVTGRSIPSPVKRSVATHPNGGGRHDTLVVLPIKCARVKQAAPFFAPLIGQADRSVRPPSCDSAVPHRAFSIAGTGVRFARIRG